MSPLDFKRQTDPENLLEGFFGKTNALSGFRGLAPMADETIVIPKTIHQIWLGSPLPAKLKKFRQTWIQAHPDWQVLLWTDQHLSEFSCKDTLDSTHCYGQKSDLLRAEIIHRYGGFYVDLDYECFRPLDPWTQGHGFIAGLRWIMQAHLGWPRVWQDPLVICNSLFGAQAGHPLLKQYMVTVQENWNRRDKLDLKENELDRMSLAVMGGSLKAAHIKETGLRTYLPFHDIVYANRSQLTVFPPKYLNPRIPQWIGLYAMPQFWDAKKKSGSPMPKLWKYSGIQSETIACHWSKASWLGS